MRPWIASGLVAACFAVVAAPARAQEGAGVAGAAVLQLPAGARAAALSGAYAAATDDAEVIFYNPAGLAPLGTALGASYTRYVDDIGFGSAAGATRLGRVVVGVGAAFLDAGEVREVVPDPVYGGERGYETGTLVGASESAVRAAAALETGTRLRLGAGAGWIATELAGASRSTAVFDVGAQVALRGVTLAAALRNIGAPLSGGGMADAPLPTEARLGAAAGFEPSSGVGVRAAADLVFRTRESALGTRFGIEAGLLPHAGGIGAVGRVGYDGDGAGLGALRLGAGLALGPLSVDYAFQNLDFLGAVHRLGIRWSRLAH